MHEEIGDYVMESHHVVRGLRILVVPTLHLLLVALDFRETLVHVEPEWLWSA